MVDFSLVIMAGGKSSRMGRDKAFVTILGEPIIEHLLSRLSELGQAETFIITNRPDDYTYLNLPTHEDIIPDKGPLGGIYTALQHSAAPYIMVVACDTPFANADLINYMLDIVTGDKFDVIVPRVEQYPQGLYAIYSRNCIPAIKKRLDLDRLKVIGFYDDVRVRYLDEQEYQSFDEKGLCFYNINTPDDLEQARKLFNQGG